MHHLPGPAARLREVCPLPGRGPYRSDAGLGGAENLALLTVAVEEPARGGDGSLGPHGNVRPKRPGAPLMQNRRAVLSFKGVLSAEGMPPNEDPGVA